MKLQSQKFKCLFIWGHKYEARYDSEPISDIKYVNYTGFDSIEDLSSLYTKKTDIHDICARCGDIKWRIT